MDSHIILKSIEQIIEIDFINDDQEPLKQADVAVGLYKLMITSQLVAFVWSP